MTAGPVSVHELHRLRPALLDHRGPAVRPAADEYAAVRHRPARAGRVSTPTTGGSTPSPSRAALRPRAVLRDRDGREQARGAEALAGDRAAPRRAKVVAVKGLGGYPAPRPRRSVRAGRPPPRGRDGRPSRWRSWWRRSRTPHGWAWSARSSVACSRAPRTRSCCSSAVPRRGRPFRRWSLPGCRASASSCPRRRCITSCSPGSTSRWSRPAAIAARSRSSRTNGT